MGKAILVLIRLCGHRNDETVEISLSFWFDDVDKWYQLIYYVVAVLRPFRVAPLGP